MPLYGALAIGYDDFFEKDYLDKIKNKYYLLLLKNGIKSGSVLDAGCGTGLLSFFLYEKGYKPVGVDLSEAMLIKASKKALEQNFNIPLYNCDVTKEFPFEGEFNAVVSSLDVVNHITEEEKVFRFFLNSYEVLAEKGVFIFDLNTYKKFNRQYADQTYVYSSHHSVCVWRNNFSKADNLCRMDIEVFEKEEGKYKKHTDSFYEKYYSFQKIKSLLRKAGFKNIDYTVIDKGTRQIIIAKK